MNREPLWYKDAVIYEVHVGSFYDGDGDGVGDFKGLTERLDYIEELGVTALWVLPFYPSPRRDDGYDIADYRDIHPDYGTMGDFENFLEEAHKRGLKVITELVINHTSDQHPWFQRARRAPEGSPERDFYVWSDTPERYSDARIVFGDVKDSNWTWDREAGAYYWHRFYKHQPDLNFDNPRVAEEILDVLDFWMEKGVDGMRLDAVTYLYEREGTNCESLPETHAFLRRLRAHVDEHYDNRMLLAEANQWPEDAIDYYGDGDECHMTFHFPLMPRLFMAVEMEDRYPIVDIIDQTPEIPENCQWAVFLRNHDELTLEMVTDEERDFMYRRYAPEMRMRFNLGIRRRLAPLMKNDRRKIELMHGLLFSVVGTPVIYYGDEIGMGDNYHLGDRDGVRTPMQWNADQNAGFSEANPQSLHLPVIHDPEYHYITTNVANQERRPSSLLSWMKRLIAVRREHPALGRGDLEFLDPGNHRVAAFRRSWEDDDVLVVMNLSRTTQQASFELSEYEGYWPVEALGRAQFPQLGDGKFTVTLPPYAFYWFSLEEEYPISERVVHHGGPARPLAVQENWDELFEGRLRSRFTDELVDYMVEQSWFQVRGQRIEAVEIAETIPVGWNGQVERGASRAVIALVEARFSNGELDTYVVPVTAARTSDAADLPEDVVMATVHCHEMGEELVLYDALREPGFCKRLLELVAKRREIQGESGRLSGDCEPGYDCYLDVDISRWEPTINPARQTHTSVLFGDEMVMKVFRRLDDRVSLDVAIGRYLSERGFKNAPELLGHLSFRRGRWEPVSMAILSEYVPHTGTAYEQIREAFDGVGGRSRAAERHEPSGSGVGEVLEGRFETECLMDLADRLEGPEREGDGILPAKTHRSLLMMGRRIAEFHSLLAEAPVDSPFAPEPFSRSYQRSRYQWMRGVAIRAFRELENKMEALDGRLHAQASRLLERREGVLERFKALIGRGIGGQRIRIHGDLHLGQLLASDGDFSIIDFEGRPGTPTGERRIKRSALRDVASLLTSVVLTAQDVFGDGTEADGEGVFQVGHEAVCEASAAVLDGYFGRAGGATYLPPEPLARAVFLDALRLEQGLSRLRDRLEAGEHSVGFLLRELNSLVD